MAEEGEPYELEDLVVQPGTYFNPQTEVVVAVDDSASIDQEVFETAAFEGSEWIRISDDVPVDEQQRDEIIERFQTSFHGGGSGSVSETALEQDDDDLGEDEEAVGREADPEE